MRDLLEEELLLCLPIVPLHLDARACRPVAVARAQPSGDPSSVQRPFERLGELLKRDTESSIARQEIKRGRPKKS
jgi:uncharacterized metal-binding protein YceD (DUF177 family)